MTLDLRGRSVGLGVLLALLVAACVADERASNTAAATESRQSPDAPFPWPSHVWFGQADGSRAEYLTAELIQLLGAPEVELVVPSAPVRREATADYSYRNALAEEVPFIVRAPGGERFTGNLAAAPHGRGLVIALHQTNDDGGVEPCADPGAALSYGTDFAVAGHLVVCPTLSFTGARQPDLAWDTTEFYAQYPTWSAMGKDVTEVSWLLDALQQGGLTLTDILVIGHSQGALYALFAAAVDQRIDRVIANAGFVDTAADPDPGRWSRDVWYRAFREAPVDLDLLEVVAALAPRCALLINYDADETLWATQPDPAALAEFERVFPSVDWMLVRGSHGWRTPEVDAAVTWAMQIDSACS